MLWLVAVLIATFISGLGTVLHRRITKDEDVPSYSFLFTLIAGLFFIPLIFLEKTRLPIGWEWIPFLAAALLWFSINIVGFTAAKHTEASLIAPLGNLKVLFLFALAVVFLHEEATAGRLIGTFLIFSGALALTWEKGALKKLKHIGVQLAIVTAFLTAVVTLLDKYNMLIRFSKSFYGAAMYLVPCLFHGIRVTRRKHQLKKIIKNQGWYILLAGVLYGILYYLYLFAYSFKDAPISVIYPISRLNLIVAVALAYIWLGERKEIKKRAIASVFMIAGAILVAI
ncbi:MAG: DMT family transporter [Candidatus Diapherotrites archaeon]|nr:DMT family transporter [Candidatus Diapherotrites archaeon]